MEALSVLSPSSRRAWIEILNRRLRFRPQRVALLAEGVDRNKLCTVKGQDELWSPSSRRAWIEIRSDKCRRKIYLPSPSSRRAWIEICLSVYKSAQFRSPSSRRAWIEMGMTRKVLMPRIVALLAEGVDRNIAIIVLIVLSAMSPSSRRAWIEITTTLHRRCRVRSRPPRGGRG